MTTNKPTKPEPIKTVAVLFLRDHYGTGHKCGDVAELDIFVAAGLVKQKICDDNPKGVAQHRERQPKPKPTDDLTDATGNSAQ